MVFLIIFVIPLSLLLCAALLGVIDVMLFDGVLSDYLKSWAKYWLDKRRPKEN